ncbi:unnamed protein product [Cuscuta campestris]|uniref:GDSL esterase/lipase n=1 Tax=Cuscuta campestris TaxID=132261 RepID=A0A484NB78_9ASTE|nr:unnamed protein product [Cuscuta campestris]
MVGLPPIGCIPIVITKHSNESNAKSRGCVDNFSSVNKDFNSQLQTFLETMQQNYSHQGSKIVYLDIYDITWDLIHQPAKYGFEVVNNGCCGTGAVELSFLCNVASSICPNTSNYVFWDSVHSTEAAYRAIFEALRPTFDSFF